MEGRHDHEKYHITAYAMTSPMMTFACGVKFKAPGAAAPGPVVFPSSVWPVPVNAPGWDGASDTSFATSLSSSLAVEETTDTDQSMSSWQLTDTYCGLAPVISFTVCRPLRRIKVGLCE
jgi:hypothetical protein